MYWQTLFGGKPIIRNCQVLPNLAAGQMAFNKAEKQKVVFFRSNPIPEIRRRSSLVELLVMSFGEVAMTPARDIGIVQAMAGADSAQATDQPTREDAAEAVRTLISWAGDDPNREGLLGTPDRVVRAYEESFAGYEIDPVSVLQRTFEETNGYDEMVLLRGIPFNSCCEHHMLPIVGSAHVAYLPRQRVVGISKLARVVETFAKRLQIQEKMTAQIASAIDDTLQPLGVGVVLEAVHQCMTTRGVNKDGVVMVTSCMLGQFRESTTRREFLSMINRA